MRPSAPGARAAGAAGTMYRRRPCPSTVSVAGVALICGLALSTQPSADAWIGLCAEMDASPPYRRTPWAPRAAAVLVRLKSDDSNSSADKGLVSVSARHRKQMGGASCASIAADLLDRPACNGVLDGALRQRRPSEDATCPVSCAELWLGAATTNCRNGKATQGFDIVAPGVSEACTATAQAVLATAPSTLMVSGLSCSCVDSGVQPDCATILASGMATCQTDVSAALPPGYEGATLGYICPVSCDECTMNGIDVNEANALFELQPSPLNGRAHYMTRGGHWHLYWTPTLALTASAAWVIDVDTDDADAVIDLMSSSQTVAGTAVWRVWCSAQAKYINNRVTLKELQEASGHCANVLAALAPELTSICCRPEDGPDCGESGVVPQACSVDCAHLWAPYAAQCPMQASFGNNELTVFFQGKCRAAAESLTVLDETVTLQFYQTHDFIFPAESGTRYEVAIRVGKGSGGSNPCAENFYDASHGVGGCDYLISTGGFSCATDFSPGGDSAHYCDLACGFQCIESGIDGTGLLVLPPGARFNPDEAGLAVVTQTQVVADKTVGFTAETTGIFTATVEAFVGTGPVTVSVHAVGTAVERAPHLIADGAPHPLSVSCHLDDCTFSYLGSVVSDADGTDFDLVIDVQAGCSYAIQVDLPTGQTATQVKATFYQPGAAGGAVGFEPALHGPLGSWSSTPRGHHSFFTSPVFVGIEGDIRSGFGIHPDGRFGSFLQGTFVSPASGPVLLRLELNCDVVFYSDVEADGCAAEHLHGNGGYGCDVTSDGIDNSRCAAELQLTVTPGAYYDEGGHRRMQSSGDNLHNTVDSHAPEPLTGTAQRTDIIVVDRIDVEAQAAALWQATPVAQRTSTAPPVMDEMLVAGTGANNLLASMFMSEQQPTVVYPVVVGAEACNSTDSIQYV